MAKLTKVQQEFIDALFGEAVGNFDKAKKLAGLPSTASVDAILSNGVKEAIIDRAKNELSVGAAEAVFGLRDIIISPTTPGAKVKLAAVTQLLDRINVTKDEKLQIDTQGGIFILPSKDGVNEVPLS